MSLYWTRREEDAVAMKHPFNVMVKPIGPICNLRCEYCFYLHKSELYRDTESFRMDDAVLERFIETYIACQPGPVIPFVWQGGEPTLMGLEFFQRVVELQKKHNLPGKRFTNSIQTNGTMFDNKWVNFLKQEEFLVGLSLDGPEEFHNQYRVDANGKGTWSQVLEAFYLLTEYGVDVNILCVVNGTNAEHPREMYRFFRESGVEYLQFIPLVESFEQGSISARSVTGSVYGKFLVTVFNEWLRDGLGDIFIQTFEEALRAVVGIGSGLCVFSKECGRQLIMEHNGDLYSCDHFVSPQYLLGNIMTSDLLQVLDSNRQQAFGKKKSDLPAECIVCSARAWCHGGCPKNRIETTNGLGLNHLCQGYKQFFTYIQPFMSRIAETLKQGGVAVQVQGELLDLQKSIWDVSRNDPCPCESSAKYKKCCGKA